MSENHGLDNRSGPGATGANDLRPLRFVSVYGGNVEISPDRSTVKLITSNEGTALINQPVRFNRKLCLRYVDIRGRQTGARTPYLNIGFTDFNSSPLGHSNVPNNARNWSAWLKCGYDEKDNILHFYVNEKGEVHYGINGEEKGMIISGVDTGKKLWVVIKLFGGLREVKLVDPEPLDGVRHPNQRQVEDGVRRLNQSSREISHPSTSNTSKHGTSNLRPLRFHSAHSNQIVISPDRSTATSTTLHSGVTFSDRPVRINEKVRFRCFNTEAGSIIPNLTIGFTSVNPATLAEYVPPMLDPMDPDYSGHKGYWMKWLRNIYYDRVIELLNENIIMYYVNEKGQVHYGINREELGVVLSDVNTGKPLWAVIQLFGGLREVKLLDPETGDGVRRSNQNQVKDGVTRPNQVENDPLVNRIRSLSVDVQQPTSKYQNLVSLILHRIKSKNIKIIQNDDGVIAGRLESVSSKSYVFSAQPMRSGQTIVVQIIGTEQNNQESLTIGLTSCDPKTLTPHELPEDVASLQDRPEYWVIYPDAANGLRIGDELAMTLTQDGKMEIKRTTSIPIAVFHVDNTINLWAFINICGTTKTVKLLVSKMGKQNKKNTKKKQKRKESQQQNSAIVSNTKEASMPSTSRQTLSECTICLEYQVDSVVYKCGHMCMCYNCAVKQWKGDGSASGRCPLCRSIITDVIRTYIP